MHGMAPTRHAPAERSSPARVARQAALFQEEATFRESMDRLPDLVLVLNDDRQIVFSNARVVEAAGGPGPGPLGGGGCGAARGGRNAAAAEGGCGTSEACRTCGAVEAVLRGLEGRSAVNECRLRVRCDGAEEALDLRVWASPLPFRREAFVFVAAQDIAHEKRRLYLERIFLHDLGNTVQALTGLFHLLRMDPGGDAEVQRRFLDDIAATTERLTDEIRSHGLLVLAEAGDLAVRSEIVAAGSLVREIAASFAVHGGGGPRVVVAAECGDPPRPPPGPRHGRVLRNMVRNAVESTPAEGVVTVSCGAADGVILFTCHNPAVMPPDVRHQVFQRSFSTKGPGRGLGTYGMRLLAERYLGGRVTFRSAEGEGTTFTAALPEGARARP